jgi:hypothetical protein
MSTDHLSRARLDARNRVAGVFLRLVNPLTRLTISAGLPTGCAEHPPDGAGSAVRQASNGSGWHARARWSPVRPGVLRRDRLGGEPSGGRRGDDQRSRPPGLVSGGRAQARRGGSRSSMRARAVPALAPASCAGATLPASTWACVDVTSMASTTSVPRSCHRSRLGHRPGGLDRGTCPEGHRCRTDGERPREARGPWVMTKGTG